MKTNGNIITRTRVKNGILSLLTLLATVPALAQAIYASENTTAYLTVRNKQSTVTSRNSYTAYEPDALRKKIEALYASVDGELINDEETIAARNAKTSKKTNVSTEKNNDLTDYPEVNFRPTSFIYPSNSKREVGIDRYSAEQLIIYAKSLKNYARKNGYDTTYAFLSNMGMLYNKKRFFVVNLTTMKIEYSGLVSQGRGQGMSVYDKQYSNQSGSKCTSLGRYKISGKYKGGYGDSYKVHGLDSTNSNAYRRNIVIHPMGCIPDKESIVPACASEGCPAVSTKFFSSLSKIIESRKKPVLMWIFDSNLEEPIMEGSPKTAHRFPILMQKI